MDYKNVYRIKCSLIFEVLDFISEICKEKDLRYYWELQRILKDE
jgi:phosphorylcholine metabolism protein LicD